METVDIQAVESKLSDVTVTPVPMTPKAQNLSINSSKEKEVSSSATITLTPSASSPTNVKESNGNSSGSSGSSSSSQPGQSKYAQLLGVIEEMGREVRPTYAGSRSSAERLKRGIVHARILVRECLVETERSARQ